MPVSNTELLINVSPDVFGRRDESTNNNHVMPLGYEKKGNKMFFLAGVETGREIEKMKQEFEIIAQRESTKSKAPWKKCMDLCTMQ